MVLLRSLVLVWLAFTLSAEAAPWPRAKGEGLVISSVDSQHHIAHWVEYGLSPGRWLSAELDFPPRGGLVESAFSVNQALPDWGAWKTSLSLGLAVRMLDPLSYPVDPKAGLQLGVALGRGFETPIPGWVALSARQRHGGEYQRLKAEATLGLRPTDRLRLIGKLQLSSGSGLERDLALQAGGQWQLTPRLGVEAALSRSLSAPNPRPVAKIASWISF